MSLYAASFDNSVCKVFFRRTREYAHIVCMVCGSPVGFYYQNAAKYASIRQQKAEVLVSIFGTSRILTFHSFPGFLLNWCESGWVQGTRDISLRSPVIANLWADTARLCASFHVSSLPAARSSLRARRMLGGGGGPQGLVLQFTDLSAFLG